MRHLEDWKNIIKEIMGKEIEYNDNVSIFVSHKNGYVVIEKEENGLQLQFRTSTDCVDTVATENIIINNKIVSDLVPSNHDDIKKALKEFIKNINIGDK